MSSGTSDNQNYIALAKVHSCVQHSGQQIHYIQELVNSNCDINYAVPKCCPQPRLFEYTALHFIVEKQCKYRDCDCSNVKLLLNHGADFTKKNDNGFTPLRLAHEFVKDIKQPNSTSTIINNLLHVLLSAHYEFNNPTNPCCNDGISHFHIACLTGELEVVKFFLENGVSVDQAIKSGEYAGCTGLHLVVQNKHEDLVRLLLEKGADSNCLNAKGQSPLHIFIDKWLSCFSSSVSFIYHERMLKEMLKSSFKDFHSFDCIGMTYLHAYCTTLHPSVQKDCRTLLDAGVDVNASINLDSLIWPGFTPLHFAALHNLETFKFLLKNGANLCAKDANGVTPLDLYLQLHDPIKLKSILNMNEILKFVEFKNNEKLKDLIKSLSHYGYLDNMDPNTVILPFNSLLWPGYTLLHLAVKLSQDYTPYMSNVERLLSKGADPTIQDANGMSPLHIAFYLTKKQLIIIQMLDHHNNTSVNPVDNNGLSHFLIACITGHKEAVAMFLTSSEVDPNVLLQTDVKPSLFEYPEIKAGSTPLHIAAITSNSWLIKLLLENGADPNLRDADGLTWMHRIFKYNKSFYFKKILSMPQTLQSNPVAACGLSHLHVVCYAGSEKAVKTLLPLINTIDINRPISNELTELLGEFPTFTGSGDTPLHIVSRTGSVRVLELLLRCGADLEVKNADGLSPMHVALASLNYSVIKCLALEYSRRKMWPDEYNLTQLHVACALMDEPMIKKFLESGKNVNSQIKNNSPIWPGDTPMHVLIRMGYPIEGDAIRLLLDYILRDIKGAALDNQPSHESVKCRNLASPKSPKFLVNSEGLSALHVSCMQKDLDIVEKFLKLEVDFDTPTDYFASRDPGFYPLHFAVNYSSDEVVEFLLKHKISVDSQDAFGNTPLHVAATYCHEKLLLFFRAKKFNVTKKNLNGETVMDLFVKGIKIYVSYDYDCTLDLLKSGLAKHLDLPTKAKLITTLGTMYKNDDFKLLIRNIPIQNDFDDKGRNIFCHIDVGDMRSKCIPYRIAKELIDIGCELDHRDKKGQTVLHHAIISGNSEKAKTLLILGADINVVDVNEKTPLDFLSMDHLEYSILNCMQRIVCNHINKLGLSNLYICPSNKRFYEMNDYHFYCQDSSFLSSMKEEIITKSFTLRQVLTEGMVMRFPIMPEYQRQAILAFLDSPKLEEDYPDWMPLFNMQRRKALQRERLYEVASESLRDLLGPRLPDHCHESILINLSTESWQNVISAVNGK